MSEPVKTGAYNSPRRQAQEAATRLDVLEAAKSLFEAWGYASTTIPDVAAPARM
jgi:AcrR family transcriptional regulator